MLKKFTAFFLTITSVILLFAACGKADEKTPQTTVPETQLETEEAVLINETEPKDEATTKSVTESEEKTTPTTELCSVPLKNPYFPTPSYQYFYNNSLKEKDTYLASEVAEIVNNSLKNGKWGLLKLAVTDDMVSKITDEETCLELVFDKNYVFSKTADMGGRKFEYDKALIVLTGEYKDCIFFSLSRKYYDGEIQNEYLSGPIKDVDGKISDTLIAHIYDEE